MAKRKMPRNTTGDCNDQFKGTKNEVVGADFCDYIHKKGKSLEECLDQLEK